MSDLAPLLLGTLLIGVVRRVCSLAGRATFFLVARRCCARLGLVAIAIGRDRRSNMGWLGLDGGVDARCAVLAAVGVGCDAILLLLVHNFVWTVRTAHTGRSPPLALSLSLALCLFRPGLFPATRVTFRIRMARLDQFLLPDPKLTFVVTQCACLPLDLYVTQLASSSWLI